MTALLEDGRLDGGDGTFDPATARHDSRTGYGRDVDYTLTDAGREFLDEFGVILSVGRPVVRYCVDWSEQRHHLAGALGRGLRDRLVDLDWIRPSPHSRAVAVTEKGRDGLAQYFGVAERELRGELLRADIVSRSSLGLPLAEFALADVVLYGGCSPSPGSAVAGVRRGGGDGFARRRSNPATATDSATRLDAAAGRGGRTRRVSKHARASGVRTHVEYRRQPYLYG
jgi:hypothetical protein